MLRIGSKLIVKNVYEKENPILEIANAIEQSISEGCMISFNPKSYNEGSRRNYVYALKKRHNLKGSIKELVELPRDEFQKLLPKAQFRNARYNLTKEEKLERFKFEDIKKYYETPFEEVEVKKNTEKHEALYKRLFDGLESCNLDFITRNNIAVYAMNSIEPTQNPND